MISVLAANAKRTIDGITGQSTVLFSSASPVQNLGPPPLKLKKILDMAPITVTDQTPMETVVDMFRKLGLRQILVTHNGYVSRCQYLPFYCSTHVFFFIFFYSMQSPAGRHHQERRSAARETNGQRRSQHGSLQLELAQQVITLCVWDI